MFLVAYSHRKVKVNNFLQEEAENHSEIRIGTARWTTSPVLSTYLGLRSSYKANFVSH